MIIVNYPFRAQEQKFRKIEEGLEKKESLENGEKYFVLEMFPYPSGNLHMGHLRNYSIGDVVARFKRMQGFEVLHPMGWDAFGLPAENAAIEHNVHPSVWTKQNIEKMKEQLKMIGLSYDWDNEITTCTPEYYKHEQRFFLDFIKKGIAYRKESFVNWDPVDNTVLANEQVIDGRGWRSGALVERKKINSWFLRVSDYAEELLTGLDELQDWPNAVLAMQKKWIGKSIGAKISFDIEDREDRLVVYTTRPETVFGASFCGIAANHPIAIELAEKNSELKNFIEECNKLATSQEAIDKAEKKGFDTGLKIKHPFIEGKLLPLYIANFILMDYGTGAIFACPAHDQRDFDFAKKYGLEITQVVGEKQALAEAYSGSGKMINSGFLDGLSTEEAKKQIIEKLQEKNIGEKETNYRIRDWGISRQRYWGCPIPIIYCDDCGTVPVPEKDLPVTLPEDVDFSGQGNPLDNHPSWKNVNCPKCNKKATRETDSFDTFFESSWYFFRFCDSKNTEIGFDKKKADKMMPVDRYIGGIEHAVLHLLYARFFTKALRDTGYTDISEPFKNLLSQGMVTNISYKNAQGDWLDVNDVIKKDDILIDSKTGEQAFAQRIEKMSKSKKNGVSPLEIIDGYGADVARLFMLSDSPPEKDLEWSEDALEGSWRYLNKIWRKAEEIGFIAQDGELELQFFKEGGESKKLIIKLHQTIKDLSSDIDSFQLNKAVARIRELSNLFCDYKLSTERDKKLINFVMQQYTKLIFPLIPYFAASINELLTKDNKEIFTASFPIFKEEYLKSDSKLIIVQINGKLRAKFEIEGEKSKEELEGLALNLPEIKERISEGEVKKVIAIPNKLVNIVYV